MKRFAAVVALATLVAVPCYGQSQSEARKAQKQRALEMKQWIRNSGFDRNGNGVLSSIERKRWERAMRERMLELERQYGSKDDTNDKKSECNKGGGNTK
jgi:hypothetical protein